MVKAGSGVCDATFDTNLDGIMCCKIASTTGMHEFDPQRNNYEQHNVMGRDAVGGTNAAAACFTAPTNVRALVWMYTWPR